MNTLGNLPKLLREIEKYSRTPPPPSSRARGKARAWDPFPGCWRKERMEKIFYPERKRTAPMFLSSTVLQVDPTLGLSPSLWRTVVRGYLSPKTITLQLSKPLSLLLPWMGPLRHIELSQDAHHLFAPQKQWQEDEEEPARLVHHHYSIDL
jgi:hypothetical protein